MEKTIKEKVYCKECQYYIEFSSDIAKIGRENEDGCDICGHSLNIFKDSIGNESFVFQGGYLTCTECGSILRDDRQPIYRKCKFKNKNNNCKDFLKITFYQRLKNMTKSVILKLRNMLKIDFSKYYLLIFWFIFNVFFFIHNDLFLILGNKQLLYYLIITITIFLAYIRK